MIRLENIFYSYDDISGNTLFTLDNINLTIERGEFIAIIGQTGSGKSTLVQLINGLEVAKAGTVKYLDQNIYDNDYDLYKLRKMVGVVFQYPEDQLFQLDVLSDVCFAPLNFGLGHEEAVKKAKEALKMVSLDEMYYQMSPFELSGGQKRRVAVAGVLAADPEVLILDEITAGLDAKGKKEILSLIKRLHQEKQITVIMVSHSMEDVANYADRVVVMEKGAIVLDDIPRNIFKQYETLVRIGLTVPRVTSVLNHLKDRGLDVDTSAITIEDATKSILSALGGGACE